MAENFKRPPQREPLERTDDYLSASRWRLHWDFADVIALAIVAALAWLFIVSHAAWFSRLVGW